MPKAHYSNHSEHRVLIFFVSLNPDIEVRKYFALKWKQNARARWRFSRAILVFEETPRDVHYLPHVPLFETLIFCNSFR